MAFRTLENTIGGTPSASKPMNGSIRVAILSFLFNWPSTGGGNVHTYELAHSLVAAGYEVCHFYVRHEAWGIGHVTETLPYPFFEVQFANHEWSLDSLQARVRNAIANYDPDTVIITDSWNIKPRLADAVIDYPYILRFQAMECLCPLNNYRLLPQADGSVRQCPKHQLATPDTCLNCVQSRQHQSGGLHQAERALSGYGTQDYDNSLRRSLIHAQSVLVVNPLHEAMLSPYSNNVRVVTAGMNSARFLHYQSPPSKPKVVFIFAGLLEEWVKGFHVLAAAAQHLWTLRQDFEIIATGDAPEGNSPAYIKFIGWQSQSELPAYLVASDVVVVPTVGQDALGRTAVEAMAAGRPVLASRIGGLPFTVTEDATGLFFKPGDPVDLARTMAKLIDEPALRRRLGEEGRRRFEDHFTWEVIIERHYRPLLQPRAIKSLLEVGTKTKLSRVIDRERVFHDASECFRLSISELRQRWDEYQRLSLSSGHAAIIGKSDYLHLEEMFLIYLTLLKFTPRTIVESRTGEGDVSRQLIDMQSVLGIHERLICHDTLDRVKYFAPSEVTFIDDTIEGRFESVLLDKYEPELVVLNVPYYQQLREAISETLRARPRCPVIVLNCLHALEGQGEEVNKTEQINIHEHQGSGEKRILAELFDLKLPLDNTFTHAVSSTHELWLFRGPHDLALIFPCEAMATSW